MTEAFAKEDFLASLDALGEDQVRFNIERQVYGDERREKSVLAREWLRQHEESRNSASSSASLRVARSAKNAAWIAAIAAIIAAICAVIALLPKGQ